LCGDFVIQKFVSLITVLVGALSGFGAIKVFVQPEYAQSIGVSQGVWVKAVVLSVALLMLGTLGLVRSSQDHR
jgi:uncharacterized membrane protein YraQ (UPF0718 family)